MKYTRKIETILDEIPPELITRKEAAELLGIGVAGGCNKRLRHLPCVEVVYKNRRIYVYNRTAVEALKYKPAPAGYITTREACKLLGYSSNCGTHVNDLMRKHNVPRKWITAHHSHFVWKKSAVEKLAAERKQNVLS